MTRFSLLGDPGYHGASGGAPDLPQHLARLRDAFVLGVGPGCDAWHRHPSVTAVGTRPPASLADLLAIADGAVAAGKTQPLLAGGEPLLHPDLWPLIHGLADRGFARFSVVTDGTPLADEAFAARVADAGCGLVALSFDDFDAARLDRLVRSQGHHDILMRALANSLALSARWLVFLQVCVCSRNFAFLSDLVRFAVDRASETGADLGRLAVNLDNIQASGHAMGDSDGLVADLADVVPELVEAVDVGRSLGVRVVVRDFPMCTLPPRLEPACSNLIVKDCLHLDDGTVVDGSGAPSRKRPQCARCRYDAFCSGFCPRYAEMYGEDLFVPVK